MAMDDSLSGGTLSPISGGCLCGQVRYVLKAPPTEGCFCHCRMCQRASGAFAVAWASVAAADFCLRRGKLRYVNSSSTRGAVFAPIAAVPLLLMTVAWMISVLQWPRSIRPMMCRYKPIYGHLPKDAAKCLNLIYPYTPKKHRNLPHR